MLRLFIIYFKSNFSFIWDINFGLIENFVNLSFNLKKLLGEEGAQFLEDQERNT